MAPTSRFRLPSATAMPPAIIAAAAACPLGLRSVARCSAGPQVKNTSFSASTAPKQAPTATSHATAPRRQPRPASTSATTAISGNTTAWSAKSVRKRIRTGLAWPASCGT